MYRRIILSLVCVNRMLCVCAQTDSTNASQLDEVVVTGQYSAQSLKNSVYKVRVINQERIRMRGATDLAGVLNNELGIRFSTDYALGETDIQIMGIGGQRVKILLDGVPLSDRDATKQSLSQIDINTIERVEIVEGPMSVVYGTDALGGVVNLITKKGKHTDNLDIGARIQEESVGNKYDVLRNNGIHNQNVNINWQKKGWRLSASGTRNNFGGYTDTAAYPAKVSKPKDQWLGAATLGYQGKKIKAWYRLDYLNEALFAAGVMNINTAKGIDQYYITKRLTHQLQSEWQAVANVKISSALSYQDYERDTETFSIDYRTKNKAPNHSGEGYWDVTRFNTLFFRSTGQWYLSPKVSLQPGFEIKRDRTSGQRVTTDAPAITDYSLFASAEIKPVDFISIRPGLRLTENSKYDAPPIIPSINTKFVLNKNLDLRLSYARGFRAPILRELYFHFYDANHQIEGNPDLKAEYSNSFITSLSWNNDSKFPVRLSSVVTGFYNGYSNFIDMALREGTQVYSYFNVSKYKTAGGTLENNLNYGSLTTTLGFSYIGRYNSYRESDKTLPEFTWSPEVNGTVLYRFKKLKADIGFFYKFTGKLPSYSTTAAGDIYLSEISSYHWADLTVGKRLLKYLSLQAGVKNLFNVKRVGSTVQNGGAHSTGGAVLTGYGRSCFVGLSFQWSKR